MVDAREKIVIIGLGWVGQANAIVLVKMGYRVFCHDLQEPKLHYPEHIEDFNKVVRLKTPTHEDGKDTWYIVCVGDRVLKTGEQDITPIKKALSSLKAAKGNVILRSTVLPENLGKLVFNIYFPEFLHEKYAVEECINPYLFVIGSHNEAKLPTFLKVWQRRAHKVFRGTPEEASHIKYLSNIWNALKVSFVNEYGDGIEKPVDERAIKRISNVTSFVFGDQSYLKYGRSFKGHCLPKDTRALLSSYKKTGKNALLLKALYASNEFHEALEKKFTDLPEWYSFWGYKGRGENVFVRWWAAFNSLRVVKVLRRRLRFIIDFISTLIPERSIAKAKKIWEKKAQKSAVYYSNFLIRNRRITSESTLTDRSKEDYQRYVTSDNLLMDVLARSYSNRALDIGSGTGQFTELLAQDFSDAHGVDIAKTMVWYAKKRLANVHNISFVESDGTNIPYPDNHFDFIFSHQTLRYIPNARVLQDVLREMYRITANSGVAKLQFGTGRGHKKWHWAYGVTAPLDRIQDLAEKAGFKIAGHDVEDIDNLWLILKK